jgi:lysophospholipase L1-like esterase
VLPLDLAVCPAYKGELIVAWVKWQVIARRAGVLDGDPMKRIVLILCVLLIGGVAYRSAPMFHEFWKMASDDPIVYASDIEAFTAADEQYPPPINAVLFVGHSNIRFWDDLQDHMQPLTVIRRGFGGAKVNDLLFYADRIITPYQSRAIVVNIGGNDISSGLGNVAKEPPDVFATYQKLIAYIRAQRPDPPIYFLALTASTSDPEYQRRAIALNKLVKDYSAQGKNLFYMDASEAILNAEGSVSPELLRSDGAHLNAAGYALLAVPVRQRLLDDEPGWNRVN